jgi:hypothetical protein
MQASFIIIAADPELIHGPHGGALNVLSTLGNDVSYDAALEVSSVAGLRKLAENRRLDIVAVENGAAPGSTDYLQIPVQPQPFDHYNIRAESLEKARKLGGGSLRIIEIRWMPVRVEQPRPRRKPDALRRRRREGRIGRRGPEGERQVGKSTAPSIVRAEAEHADVGGA